MKTSQLYSILSIVAFIAASIFFFTGMDFIDLIIISMIIRVASSVETLIENQNK